MTYLIHACSHEQCITMQTTQWSCYTKCLGAFAQHTNIEVIRDSKSHTCTLSLWACLLANSISDEMCTWFMIPHMIVTWSEQQVTPLVTYLWPHMWFTPSQAFLCCTVCCIILFFDNLFFCTNRIDIFQEEVSPVSQWFFGSLFNGLSASTWTGWTQNTRPP